MENDRDVILEPMFGRLFNDLPCYTHSTFNLKTRIHTRKVGTRPFIELEPTNHSLAIEQKEGISLKRVYQIAESILHKND
ncbi:DUF2199 domain-containing protein [Paenibacillus prosopidis]|uniref:DUF2199 domain-containing protein n=1 Tax=Paenibacillus prosopidis TaxID=630520 RepID=UPI000DF2E9EE